MSMQHDIFKAQGCRKDRKIHYYKECKNLDSDHKSEYCPNLKTKKGQNQRCKVIGCRQNHKQHYCKICQQKDSDHRAYQCPCGIIIYHGMKTDLVQSECRKHEKLIQMGQLQGRLVCQRQSTPLAGVYFTSSRIDAEKIAKRSGCQVVFIQQKITEGEFKQCPTFKRIKIVKIHDLEQKKCGADKMDIQSNYNNEVISNTEKALK